MILLHRLNGKEFVVNCEQITFVEATPDTLVTLSAGEKFLVRESVEELTALVLAYRRRIAAFGAGES